MAGALFLAVPTTFWDYPHTSGSFIGSEYKSPLSVAAASAMIFVGWILFVHHTTLTGSKRVTGLPSWFFKQFLWHGNRTPASTRKKDRKNKILRKSWYIAFPSYLSVSVFHQLVFRALLQHDCMRGTVHTHTHGTAGAPLSGCPGGWGAQRYFFVSAKVEVVLLMATWDYWGNGMVWFNYYHFFW